MDAGTAMAETHTEGTNEEFPQPGEPTDEYQDTRHEDKGQSEPIPDEQDQDVVPDRGRSKILMNSPKILRKFQPMMERREKTTRNQHLQVPLNQMRKKAIRTMTMMTTTSLIRKMRHTAVDII